MEGGICKPIMNFPQLALMTHHQPPADTCSFAWRIVGRAAVCTLSKPLVVAHLVENLIGQLRSQLPRTTLIEGFVLLGIPPDGSRDFLLLAFLHMHSLRVDLLEPI